MTHDSMRNLANLARTTGLENNSECKAPYEIICALTAVYYRNQSTLPLPDKYIQMGQHTLSVLSQ